MAAEITLRNFIWVFLLLVIPLGVSSYLKLKLNKTIITAVGRMTLQLFLVGIFLEYIFKLNNPWLNIGWLTVMILTAVLSALNRSQLKLSFIFLPVFISFIISTLSILFYFNFFIIHLSYLFDARYLIALGGMLLGNILSVNIIAINSFYKTLRNSTKLYFYRLAAGATLYEALMPFLRDSFRLTLTPVLAKTATMGIVSLPGMMTGQILGGSSPQTAIRYQIAIMIAIFTAGVISIVLTFFLAIKKSFDKCGILHQNIFKK